MARTPHLIDVNLHDLMMLLSYKWAAINSFQVGELGPQVYQDMLQDMDVQSSVRLKPAQLADLVYHMKEAVMQQVKPRFEFTIKNHNKIMRKLKSRNPDMFKELPTGEVVMVELEEKAFE